jgi:hypothetical protein
MAHSSPAYLRFALLDLGFLGRLSSLPSSVVAGWSSAWEVGESLTLPLLGILLVPKQ